MPQNLEKNFEVLKDFYFNAKNLNRYSEFYNYYSMCLKYGFIKNETIEDFLTKNNIYLVSDAQDKFWELNDMGKINVDNFQIIKLGNEIQFVLYNYCFFSFEDLKW